MEYDILHVLKYYGLLPKHVTSKFKIVCPIHEDDDASCYIDTVRNTFYCFGCQRTGDAQKLIEGVEGINSLQAMLKYRKIMKGEKNSNPIMVKHTKQKNINEALKEAKLYFYTLPKPTWRSIKRNYMYDRGFTQQVLIENDIKINADAGYRIICPIYDCGRFRGYVKRRTDGNESDRKYLYNEGFRRNLIVMGDYNLGGWIPITEGYMDWLKLKQNGVTNASAIFGWAIKDKQIEKIKQYSNKVISALDNTPTGEQGTELLKQYFDVVRFQFPDNCKDVGDLTNIQFKKAWYDTLLEIKKI